MVMGIYDREYYRRDGPGFLGAFTERGKVCKALILANVICFVLQLLSQQGLFQHVPVLDHFTDNFELKSGALHGLTPDQFRSRFPRYSVLTDSQIEELLAQRPEFEPGVLQGQVWRLLTYSFLHSPTSLWHILINMLFLWWFGTDVEDHYGHREFLVFYLLSAALGGVGFVLVQMAGWGGLVPCVGASGAVTAVMVLCALHYPNRIILLFFVIPCPLWLLVILQVAQDAFGFLSGNSGGTAVSVHLTGAAFAYAYHRFHWRLTSALPDLRSWWRGVRRQRARPRLRVYREEEPVTPVHATPPAPHATAAADEQLEAQVDAVLAKVAQHGRDSLTESEREILLRASEIYKRRRS
jgi:membrane associated rhomboid family serine protease